MSSNFFSEFYISQFKEENTPLPYSDDIKIDDEKKEQIKKTFRDIGKRNKKGPLSEDEALIYEAKIDEKIFECMKMKERVKNIQDKLEDRLKNMSDVPTFKIKVTGKSPLKNALRQVYGKNVEEITYDMYRDLCKRRKEIMEKDGRDYVDGKLE